jgi:O-antigen ligase
MLVITFAVLSHGAVEPWSRAVVECAAGLLLMLWAAFFFYAEPERRINFPKLLWPMVALAALAVVQLAFHLTASIFSTRIELLLLLSILVLMFLTAQVFSNAGEWRQFAWFIMLLAFAVSGFGILQHLTFNGKLYWVREMRYGGIPFGPYVNRNHFAGFAELVLPMSLVPLLLGRVRRERTAIVGILAIIPLSALLLSASRGGIVGLGAELAFLVLIVILQKSAGRHLFVGGLVLLAALGTVSWLGMTQVLARFSALQTLEVTQSKRAAMRSGAWHIFLDHPVLGTGLGTLQQVYPPYETLYDGKIVNHAHNDYVEALAETGALGGLCCACFLGIMFVEPLRLFQKEGNSFGNTLRLCGLTGCCGLLVHSLVDFNLHIPSNLLLFVLMAQLATAAIPEAHGNGKRRRRHGAELGENPH